MVLFIGMELNVGETEVIFCELKKIYDPFYFLFIVLLLVSYDHLCGYGPYIVNKIMHNKITFSRFSKPKVNSQIKIIVSPKHITEDDRTPF